MSIAAKLHILLITTILGVGLYMFLLYKEIKLFENEISNIHLKINALASKIESPIIPVKEVETTVVPSTLAVITENVDTAEDDMSVTSNEIKEILTNIQDISDTPEVTVEQPDNDITIVPKSDNGELDLKNMSDDDIRNLKYDVMRATLRKFGKNSLGKKQELIDQLLSIKAGLLNS